MSKPVGDGLDAHHLPANSTTNIARGDGPAIQILPEDHRNTLSYGSKAKNIESRKQVKKLIDEGQARKSLAMEIRDVRRVARDAGDPRRYNQALLQAAKYAKGMKNSIFKK